MTGEFAGRPFTMSRFGRRSPQWPGKDVRPPADPARIALEGGASLGLRRVFGEDRCFYGHFATDAGSAFSRTLPNAASEYAPTRAATTLPAPSSTTVWGRAPEVLPRRRESSPTSSPPIHRG